MFSRKTAFLIGIVLFIATSFTILTISSRYALSENSVERIAISLISPFQMIVSSSFIWCADIWWIYFNTISAAEENRILKSELALAKATQNRCRELELENSRLRQFINFNNDSNNDLVAAKVIGRDPSPWFQTLMINKGSGDGLSKGLPVIVAEGIVGQIVDLSEKFSRVLLITDRNSAVDALVQSSRARGVVQGNNTEQCMFKYALRKDEIVKGDIIISSGLDQIFPKGLRIGEVIDIKKENCDLFQMIFIKTFVNFDKLEEVLVSINSDVNAGNGENNHIYIDEVEDEGGDGDGIQTEYDTNLFEQSKKTNSQQEDSINSSLQTIPDGLTQEILNEREHTDTKPLVIKKSAKNRSSKSQKPSMKEETVNLNKTKEEQKKIIKKEGQ